MRRRERFGTEVEGMPGAILGDRTDLGAGRSSCVPVQWEFLPVR